MNLNLIQKMINKLQKKTENFSYVLFKNNAMERKKDKKNVSLLKSV